MTAQLVGERLLNYEIKSFLRSESFYDFYLAEHLLFDRKVLIKTLNSAFLQNTEAKENLRREAQNLRFAHPQGTLLYDFIETPENIYLIKEYLENKLTLEQYIIQNGTLTEEKMLRIFRQILDILASAHHIGIIHPALNPKNIILEGNQVKIIGFESSALQEKNFQSPEEIQKGNLSVESNIFSLGKIACFMLFGTTELPKKHTNSLKIYEAIAIATEKNPKERFHSCTEFATALSEEVSIEEVEVKHAYKHLPLMVLGVLLALLAFMLYDIADETDEQNRLVYNLYDKARIKKIRDSVRNVRKQEFIRDSIRIAQNKAENLQKIHIHKVKQGETLKEIAEKYNMSVSHLKQLNGFTDKTTLKVDAGLRVVIRDYHKVLDKEELWQIAQKYGISKFDIIRANDIEDELKDVYPGADLIIPIKK
ncbi:protein kinase domain-containing protein [Raineya orbicola]|jgi:serine/threonine protein kinase|uniref:Protein kinase domain n=1 Tax=Raineya orbicola TaxID=2016530 RepID=A0A2N3IJQ1_9BACT|nr:LysM peptidoglycan-binding domain-containing protein [Raineya orbicola]PKQ70536.1 Protein kinase domain [Raineya orbicola]